MNDLSIYANGTCSNCGGEILGDGYTVVLHCENAEIPDCTEPDANTVLCAPPSPEAAGK